MQEKNYIFKNNEMGAYKVTVKEDSFADNPFEWYDHYSTVYLSSRTFSYNNLRKRLGNPYLIDNFKEIFGVEPQKEIETDNDFVREARNLGFNILPVWGYSHSGLTIRCGEDNPFESYDSGKMGYIWSKEMVEEDLEAQINELDMWLQGYVYRISIQSLDDVEDFFDIDNCYPYDNGYELTPEEIMEGLVSEGFEGALENCPNNLMTLGELKESLGTLIKTHDLSSIPSNIIDKLKDVAKL